MYDFFYCYYFAERFSFVESFEIRSSNIQNDVMRMKCWMKQRVNQSNIKIFVGWAWKCWMKNLLAIKFWSNTIFLHRTGLFLFLLFLRSVKTNPIFYPTWHFCYVWWNVGPVQQGLWKTPQHSQEKILRQILTLNKVASLQPDALLKVIPAQLFSWDFRDIFRRTC